MFWKKKKKLEPGLAVVYRLTAYAMVKTGVLVRRTTEQDGCAGGWLVRDDGDGRLYCLYDSVAKIRIPDKDEDTERYQRHVKVRTRSGRIGVLPNLFGDADPGHEMLDEDEHEHERYRRERPLDAFDEEAATPASTKPARTEKASISGLISDEVSKEISTRKAGK